MFPNTLEDALEQIDEHIITNLMPPPHYKYRLNSLIVDKLRTWDVASTNQFPLITVFYPHQTAPTSIDPNLVARQLPNTKLILQFKLSEMKKFINAE